MPKEAERELAGETDEKESSMEQKTTKRSYRLFVGVDIAYRDFTASLVQEAKTTREPHPYPQTAPGFERFQKRLEESGVPPPDTLVVMEATGSSWVALAHVMRNEFSSSVFARTPLLC